MKRRSSSGGKTCSSSTLPIIVTRDDGVVIGLWAGLGKRTTGDATELNLETFGMLSQGMREPEVVDRTGQSNRPRQTSLGGKHRYHREPVEQAFRMLVMGSIRGCARLHGLHHHIVLMASSPSLRCGFGISGWSHL